VDDEDGDREVTQDLARGDRRMVGHLSKFSWVAQSILWARAI
jgi:hypothetical protein